MVSIRKITRKDTKKIIKWRNSKAVMNVFIDRNPLTKEQHYNWLETKVKTGEVVQFIISDDEKDIGSVYFRDINNNHKKAEIGIFIGDDEYMFLKSFNQKNTCSKGHSINNNYHKTQFKYPSIYQYFS